MVWEHIKVKIHDLLLLCLLLGERSDLNKIVPKKIYLIIFYGK